MSVQYFEEIITSKYIFIKMSFYLNIVCKNIVRDVGLTVKAVLEHSFRPSLPGFQH